MPVKVPSENRSNWAVLLSVPNTHPSIYNILELYLSCLYITTSWGNEYYVYFNKNVAGLTTLITASSPLFILFTIYRTHWTFVFPAKSEHVENMQRCNNKVVASAEEYVNANQCEIRSNSVIIGKHREHRAYLLSFWGASPQHFS